MSSTYCDPRGDCRCKIRETSLRNSESWHDQTLLDPAADDPRILAIRAFNQRLATDPRFTAIIIPMRAGIAAAVFEPAVG